jgi:hypothetical protein
MKLRRTDWKSIIEDGIFSRDAAPKSPSADLCARALFLGHPVGR